MKHYTAELQHFRPRPSQQSTSYKLSVWVSERYHSVKPTISDEEPSPGLRMAAIRLLKRSGQSTSCSKYHFNESRRAFFLITGPNMSGKSTYMRQLALCVILAPDVLYCQECDDSSLHENLYAYWSADDLISSKYVHGRDDGDKPRASKCRRNKLAIV